MHLKIRIYYLKLWRRVRKALKDLSNERIKAILTDGGNLDNAMDKIEDIFAAEKDELKFFKRYFFGSSK